MISKLCFYDGGIQSHGIREAEQITLQLRRLFISTAINVVIQLWGNWQNNKVSSIAFIEQAQWLFTPLI